MLICSLAFFFLLDSVAHHFQDTSSSGYCPVSPALSHVGEFFFLACLFACFLKLWTRQDLFRCYVCKCMGKLVMLVGFPFRDPNRRANEVLNSQPDSQFLRQFLAQDIILCSAGLDFCQFFSSFDMRLPLSAFCGITHFHVFSVFGGILLELRRELSLVSNYLHQLASSSPTNSCHHVPDKVWFFWVIHWLS